MALEGGLLPPAVRQGMVLLHALAEVVGVAEVYMCLLVASLCSLQVPAAGLGIFLVYTVALVLTLVAVEHAIDIALVGGTHIQARQRYCFSVKPLHRFRRNPTDV